MRHNVYATFMAKPMAGEPGSSMHWHVSLIDESSGKNTFASDAEEKPEFLSFIAGLQTFLPEFLVMFAPYVNSFRRFTRYQSAPINLQWGYDNRTVGLRVPNADPANRRIESRLAGADANPYLAIAASLAAGYLGMERGLAPSQAETGNAYRRPVRIPRNLDHAVDRFTRSKAAREVFGSDFVTVFAAIKRREFDRYFEVISPWEREHLLLSV
jgi:glutamine synthetase